MRLAHFLALAALTAGPAVQAACTAESGPQRNRLLELYTSEGCSSCPPADRYLSGLMDQAGVVPLAFHVDYWNHLGWRDPFSQAAFSQRQRDYARSSGSRVIYTPQFILDGKDWRRERGDPPWREGAAHAPTRIALSLDWLDGQRLEVRGTLSGRTGRVWLALYENGLETAVPAGENAGRRLRHDFVVRSLAGPLEVRGQSFGQVFPTEAGWNRRGLGVAAFAAGEGEVLQAVSRTVCGAADQP